MNDNIVVFLFLFFVNVVLIIIAYILKLPDKIKLINMTKGQKSIHIYYEYFKENLIGKIPNEMLKYLPQNEDIKDDDPYIIDLTYYINPDPGRCLPRIDYVANNENDLKQYIFTKITWNIAAKMELNNREYEESKFRYVSKYNNHNVYYIQNKNYTYNTVHDCRKYLFEYHLKLLKDTISTDLYNDKAAEYTNNLNDCFKEQHWKFNAEEQCFVEISNSLPCDADGKEIVIT